MKAFVIYLPDREHSVKSASAMIPKLTEYGFEASLFIGTDGKDAERQYARENRTLYPYGVKTRDLEKEEIETLFKKNLPENFWEDHRVSVQQRYKWNDNEIRKNSAPGVKGCFDSHYRLWKMCIALNERIAIFEDDVQFTRGYLDVEFKEVLIVSLGKNSFTEEPYKTYLENPTGPHQAIPWRNTSMPGASGYMITPRAAKRLVKFYKNHYAPADAGMNKFIVNIEIHNYIMGRNMLASEGNISMTRYSEWDKDDEE